MTTNWLPNDLPQSKVDYMNRVLCRFIKLPDILDFVRVAYHCEIPLETCIEHLKVFESKLIERGDIK